MPTSQSFCNGFIDCSMKTCEVGSEHTISVRQKYVPGTPASLVEKYSGSNLGIALNNQNSISSSMCINLSSQPETFTGIYNGNNTAFAFNLIYKLYNVRKVINGTSVEYHLITDASELYIGPENILAVSLEWTRPNGSVLSGWMSYSTKTTPQLQNWDGNIGATAITNQTIITDQNLLWYAYHDDNRTKANGVYSGEHIAFQSYGRVQTMGLDPLNPYVGGIMQKDNNSSFVNSSPSSCAVIDSNNTIAFMISGQNNILKESSTSFGKGYIDFCSSTEEGCGNCSLVYFQIATPNGCIQGKPGLNNAQIISIVIGSLSLVIILTIIWGYASPSHNPYE
jgi:hypothetical protein